MNQRRQGEPGQTRDMPAEADRDAKPKPNDQAQLEDHSRRESKLEGECPPLLKWLVWIWDNWPRRRGWTLVAIAIVLIPAASPLYSWLHTATCTWDASGQYQIDQTDYEGSKSIINLTLGQKGKQLTGSAVSVAGTAGFDKGKVEGTVDNITFKLRIQWDRNLVGNYPIGNYRGLFDPNNGTLEGIAYDETAPASTAKWQAKYWFACRWFPRQSASGRF